MGPKLLKMERSWVKYIIIGSIFFFLRVFGIDFIVRGFFKESLRKRLKKLHNYYYLRKSLLSVKRRFLYSYNISKYKFLLLESRKFLLNFKSRYLYKKVLTPMLKYK